MRLGFVRMRQLSEQSLSRNCYILVNDRKILFAVSVLVFRYMSFYS